MDHQLDVASLQCRRSVCSALQVEDCSTKNIHARTSMCCTPCGQAGFTLRGLALCQGPHQLPCMAVTVCKQTNVFEGLHCSATAMQQGNHLSLIGTATMWSP
ncbi:hypothetical protein CHARACLAT_001174 [Characodon lateralis]|uniref:Uncharacterized protein n=1 Tax=Characodon lateralis TaxID=208331 RepID=A0ABU7DCN4_9TELE|nr:hypothetical protein [Characodon lateralis]